MPNCCVFGCNNNLRNSNVTLHNFPREEKEPERYKAWKDVINRKNFKPNHNHVVCSAHFKGEDFVGRYKKNLMPQQKVVRRLLKTAVPSLYLRGNKKDEKTVQCEQGTSISDLLFSCERSNLEIYHCKHCDFKTNTGIFFCDHFQRIHAKKKKNLFTPVYAESYICKNCNFSTSSLLILLKHNLTCEENFEEDKEVVDKTQCSYCIFKAVSRSSLKEHVIRKHTPLEKIKWYNCNQCDYKGKMKSDLRRHIPIHKLDYETLSYFCSRCEFKSRNKTSIRKHILAKHTAPKNVRKFECKICNYKTARKGELRIHIIRHHTVLEEIQWYQCDTCSYRCKLKRDLTQHVKKHNVAKYECNTCKYKTHYKGSLKNHIIRLHTAPEDIEWHQCRYCNYKGVRKASLTMHMKFKHTAVWLNS